MDWKKNLQPSLLVKKPWVPPNEIEKENQICAGARYAVLLEGLVGVVIGV
jgi:hypothetical protein